MTAGKEVRIMINKKTNTGAGQPPQAQATGEARRKKLEHTTIIKLIPTIILCKIIYINCNNIPLVCILKYSAPILSPHNNQLS